MTLWNKLLSVQSSASSVKCLHSVHVGTTLGYNDTFILYILDKAKTNYICLQSKYLFWTLTRELFSEGRLSSYTYITHTPNFSPIWLSSHTYGKLSNYTIVYCESPRLYALLQTVITFHYNSVGQTTTFTNGGEQR